MTNKNILILTTLLALLFTTILPAQVETAANILKIPISPMLNGMAAVGSALPSADEFAHHYNPAQIAYSSRIRTAAAQFYPNSIKLSAQSKPSFKASTANIGIYLGGRQGKSRVILGLGYTSGELDMGTVILRDTTGLERDRMLANETYYGFTLGIGYQHFISFNIGFTYKRISSNTGYLTLPDQPFQRLSDRLGAVDYGMLLIVPILKRNPRDRFGARRAHTNFQPYLDLSIGYAQLNIGDEVNYSDLLPNQPLPRSASLGYGLSFGIESKINKSIIELVSLNWSVQANDLLVKGTNSNYGYQSFMGDISIGRNILKAQGDEKVESHLGYSIELGETFRYSGGYYEGAEYDHKKAHGFAIRTMGLFKLLRKKYTRSWYSFIIEKMDIRYFNSVYYVDNNYKSRFQGISFFLSNF